MHLTTTYYKRPPTGVGIKTLLQARELGLIEIDVDLKSQRARLTQLGAKARLDYAAGAIIDVNAANFTDIVRQMKK